MNFLMRLVNAADACTRRSHIDQPATTKHTFHMTLPTRYAPIECRPKVRSPARVTYELRQGGVSFKGIAVRSGECTKLTVLSNIAIPDGRVYASVLQPVGEITADVTTTECGSFVTVEQLAISRDLSKGRLEYLFMELVSSMKTIDESLVCAGFSTFQLS
ncbi:hypothetical protein [Fimbriiglobus ruber]|uniref:hypothetical protein n=1 Tax=Fimbriiglobus ruber TaxID=1908690 RepID=UPI00117A3C3E|nr:hypothetical protein [Fimbriiglobus ruber]